MEVLKSCHELQRREDCLGQQKNNGLRETRRMYFQVFMILESGRRICKKGYFFSTGKRYAKKVRALKAGLVEGGEIVWWRTEAMEDLVCHRLIVGHRGKDHVSWGIGSKHSRYRTTWGWTFIFYCLLVFLFPSLFLLLLSSFPYSLPPSLSWVKMQNPWHARVTMNRT